MKILLIGGGGREHAVACKLAENPEVEKIYCAPGNGGTASMDICENIAVNDIEGLADFAARKQVDFTFVGPEDLLVRGIADRFRELHLPIFGPTGKGAILEGSKAYAKEFMQKYGVKTAAYRRFDNSADALAYLDGITDADYPIVIKADGLALGKGVIICEDAATARKTAVSMLDKGAFAGAGKTIVVEEFLTGKEVSILTFCDGKTILPLLSAKDHKRIFDGDRGENTGGMGAISPNPYATQAIIDAFNRDILKPTLAGIQAENMDFIGVIFFGLMVNEKGVYLLEYNVRLGDPETQAILPLMKSDLVELTQAAMEKRLDRFAVEWREGCSTCITMVSGGYPGGYQKGYPIEGIGEADAIVYVAGAELEGSTLKTSGGRVLNVVALGDTPEASWEKAYNEIGKISFKDAFYRRDIGK